MKKDIIKDIGALRTIVAQSVQKSTRHLLPEEASSPQAQPGASPPPPPAPAPAPSQGQGQQAPQGGTPVSVGKVAAGQAGATDQTGDLQKGQITLDMVVDRLNSIRSGRSFRDENISQQMQAYFNDLNDNERLALFAFMKGIAQIVTGEIPGQQAPAPANANPAIEMIDQGGGNIRHVKPNVMKKAASPTRSPSPENTAAPAPIVAKQR